jgi:hypothetical protein
MYLRGHEMSKLGKNYFDMTLKKSDYADLTDLNNLKLRHYTTEELDDLVKQTIRGLIIIDERARHRMTGTDDPTIAIEKVIKSLQE